MFYLLFVKKNLELYFTLNKNNITTKAINKLISIIALFFARTRTGAWG
jgi:hypothetical protein